MPVSFPILLYSPLYFPLSLISLPVREFSTCCPFYLRYMLCKSGYGPWAAPLIEAKQAIEMIRFPSHESAVQREG
jgi:hypothetical protein